MQPAIVLRACIGRYCATRIERISHSPGRTDADDNLRVREFDDLINADDHMSAGGLVLSNEA